MTRSIAKFVPILFCLGVLIPCGSRAQPFVRQVDAIPVEAGGVPLALPFAGGVNSPTHQFADLDGDGDKDLVLLDNDLTIDYYRNEGNRFVPSFKLRNGVIPLPPFSRWFLFLDFDSDGRIDLCTEDTTYAGVKVYRNTGTVEAPVFIVLHSTLIDSAGNRVFAGQNSIPAFVDIDADTDFDFISPNNDGSVNFYENIGSASLPLYAFRTGFWQHIAIYGDTCTTVPARDRLHGAAAYTFADIDGDGDFDMFIGDLFSTSLFYLCNIGTPEVPHMVCCSLTFPPPQPVQTQGFNHATFTDIDADADLDLFVGALGGIVQTDGFRFYKNNGSATIPAFQLQTKNYLSMIDAGLNAHPAFVDIDTDGDQDMFIGNLNGHINYFRNSGTATAPAFTFTDTIYQGIIGGFSFIPAFVDIDNDGKKDLFVGKYDGHIDYYRNAGSLQAAVFVLTPSPVDTIRVSLNAAPAVVDIDNDGDNDLFVGSVSGTIRYYRNDGSPSSFQPVLASLTYQSISAGQNSIPTFSDIDADGDHDLFIGTSEGRIEFYRNIGSPANAQFIRVTNAFANTAPGLESSPAFVDIDADGDSDLFLGVIKGGVQFYRNQLVPNSMTEENLPEVNSLDQNYPNPFNAGTAVRYVVGTQSVVMLRVFDLLGRPVATLVNELQAPGRYSVFWDASGVSSGVYYCRLDVRGFVQTRKLVYVR